MTEPELGQVWEVISISEWVYLNALIGIPFVLTERVLDPHNYLEWKALTVYGHELELCDGDFGYCSLVNTDA